MAHPAATTCDGKKKEQREYHDTARCFGLVLLSLIALPLSLAFTLISFLQQALTSKILPTNYQIVGSKEGGERRKTILVTGVGMSKGLSLARAFHLSGHRVVGADFEDVIIQGVVMPTVVLPTIPCAARFSRSLDTFYRLPRPSSKGNNATSSKDYASFMVHIVKKEKVDLWVSCSAVTAAIDDAVAKEAINRETRCRCAQFDDVTTSLLNNKSTFMRFCRDNGLPIPHTVRVTSPEQVLRVLRDNCGGNEKDRRKYILKPIDLMDDAYRSRLALLPLALAEKTEEHVRALPISGVDPWILQQYIPGADEYCTHALVVRGQLRCFVACPSTDMLMHYRALEPDDGISVSARAFTEQFLSKVPDRRGVTGHLSFDFMAQPGSDPDPDPAPGNSGGVGMKEKKEEKKKIYAIECNPRAHTAAVFFAQRGPEMRDMVSAYLSILDDDDEKETGEFQIKENKKKRMIISPPRPCLSRYWLAYDLTTLLLQPLLRVVASRPSTETSREVINSVHLFLLHVLTWKEGTFEAWDPLPWLMLHHVFFPLLILSAWWSGNRWSRINVSTLKLFKC
ncbi:carbamoylphosphate synthase large subunit [Xylariaceae sp. FL0594]|nr:carbamoylphosphate synthase large subunit [Xylariaceae sp. FL0594]